MFEIALLIGLYLAWSVGVLTLGTTLGISIGSGILNLRKAVLISGIFAVIGAIFLSERIAHTIGENLVHMDSLGLLVVLISAGLLVSIFAFKGIPIFTTYLVMGAIAGYSIVSGIAFNTTLYTKILASLLIAPVAAFALGFLIYHCIKKFIIKKIKSIPKRESFETKFFIPSLIALIIISIALGANSIGVVVGILGGKISYMYLGILGSIGMIIGLITWSYKIAKTVGVEITDLSPSRGFSAHLAAGLVVLFFIWMSIPISVTQTLIGSIIGVGIARGNLETKSTKNIALSWIIGLPLAIGLAALIGWLI